MKEFVYIVENLRTHKTEHFSSVIHYFKGALISTLDGNFYKVIRMINHGNRDKQGNRYTTDKIIHLSDIGWKNWNDEYLNYIEKQNG